ncbi:MAG: MarR family transcriptional regulator [Pseudomonadota bacterium]
MAKNKSEQDDSFIGYAMTDVARLMRTVFERRVRDHGLTLAQWVVLTRVHTTPGLSQSEVADILEIEKATAGRLIDKMEAKGWLERRPDPKDRRINRLHLLDRAERIHRDIFPIAEATVMDAFSSLSVKERDVLSGLMRRVRSTLLDVLATESVASLSSETGTAARRSPARVRKRQPESVS